MCLAESHLHVSVSLQNIAQSLTDMDLIFIEEAFERLLLDYDRGEREGIVWKCSC